MGHREPEWWQGLGGGDAPRRLDIFCTCYGETRCPSQAGQILRLECPSSQVAEHILPITYGVPQFLVELDILQTSECPNLQWLDRFS